MSFNPDQYLAQKGAKSDFNPDAYLSQKSQTKEPEEYQEPGFIQKYILPISRVYDSFGGSPTRKALANTINKQNPLKGFAEQIGEAPELAPTGKEIAEMAGVSDSRLSDIAPDLYTDGGTRLLRGLLSATPLRFARSAFSLKKGGLLDPRASEAVGLGVDIGADWTNAVPGALAVKSLAKSAGSATKGFLKGSAKVVPPVVNAATGTKLASMAVDAGADVAKAVKKQIDEMTKPAQATDWAKHLKVAKANNINPENLPASIEFGKESFPSRMERHIRETPVGEDLMTKFHTGLNEVNDAIDRHVGKVAGGNRLDQMQAGEALVSAWKKGESKLFSGLDLTYSRVQKYAPGLYLNKEAAQPYLKALNGAEKQAKGLARRGFGPQKEAGANLSEIVFQLRNAKNFKQNVEALRNLGDIAFTDAYTKVGKVPPSQEKLQDLYFKLREALVETVRKDINPDFATELQKNNEILTQFIRDKSKIYGTIGNKSAAPEQIYSTLIKQGDSNQLKVLKQYLDPNELSAIKGTYLNDLIARNPEGQVLFGRTVQNLKKNKNQIKVLFSPEEIENLGDLLRLGNSFGPSVLSTSGTGASIAFKEMFTEPAKQTLAKKALSYVKDRARNVTSNASSGIVGPSPSAAPQSVPIAGSSPTPSGLLTKQPQGPGPMGLLKAKRGKVEGRLKLLQSVSPSYYEREGEQ